MGQDWPNITPRAFQMHITWMEKGKKKWKSKSSFILSPQLQSSRQLGPPGTYNWVQDIFCHVKCSESQWSRQWEQIQMPCNSSKKQAMSPRRPDHPRAQEKESQCFQKTDRKQWPGFKGQLCSINHPELALEPRSIQSQWAVVNARVPQNTATNLQHQHHVRARNLGPILESAFWPDPRESVHPLSVRSSASYYTSRKERKWTLTKKLCIL